MVDTIKKNAHSDAYVMVQFLKNSVWPRANDAILQHDAFSWYAYPYHNRYYSSTVNNTTATTANATPITLSQLLSITRP